MSKIYEIAGSKKIPNGNNELIETDVFKIPLNDLKYNIQNGRIATSTLPYIDENKFSGLNDEQINEIIEKILVENENEIKTTKKNIEIWGQKEAGVVLKDGTVIDGNRRFTCLRQLNKEFPDNEKFKYFEAVILNDEDLTEKNLKAIEWILQMGTEKRVNYNPIEKAYDLYINVEIKKNHSINEYSKLTNTQLSDANQLLKKAKIINDFLNYIKQSGRWDLAKELKLDSPASEITNLTKIVSDNEREVIKNIMFDYLIVPPTKDIGKYIRDNLINKSLPSKIDNDLNIFINNHEKIHSKINEILDQNNYSIDSLKSIRDNDIIKEDLINNIEDYNIKKKCNKAKEKPIAILKEINTKIDNGIDIDILKNVDEFSKSNATNLIDEICNKLIKIKNSL